MVNNDSDNVKKIIVHNCRCRRIGIPFGIEPTARVAKLPDGTWEEVSGDVTAAEWLQREYNINVRQADI